MPWEVEVTDECRNWWRTLSQNDQDRIAHVVDRLIEYGPTLSSSLCSGIKSSRHSHMRELKAQSSGVPLRVFYAFDPRRVAILLIGADKTGNDRFYEEYVPIADRLYEQYLEELRQEGLIQ
jgi:hypothetical protein